MENTVSDNSIVIPVPISVRVLDPADIWSKHVCSRRVIYLDTSIWIALTDAQAVKAEECLAICREAIRRKVAIFPLSFASICELLRQPAKVQREHQAVLMQELSEGVTFRSSERIQVEEAQVAFKFYSTDQLSPLSRSALFSYVLEYLDDGFLSFKAGRTVAWVRRCLEIVRASNDIRSLQHLIRSEEIRKGMIDGQIESRFVSSMTETIQENVGRLRSQGRFGTDRMRFEERSALLKSTVIPTFKKMVLDENLTADLQTAERRVTSLVEDFRRRHGKGGPKLMEKMFKLMPATELFAQLSAARGMNPSRLVRRQDFWDIEHARVPGAYSDAFVTLDRGLIDLLVTRSSVPKETGCRIIGDLGNLVEFVCDCLDGNEAVKAEPDERHK